MELSKKNNIFLKEKTMKKIIITILLITPILTGCTKEQIKEKDYSNYQFTNTNWTRDNGADIETIKFNSNGKFIYYCSCGNPVNDSDMCETYTYNDNTKEIKLECFETTEETITKIKIIEIKNETLKLDFDGEIREFKKSK